jgi:MoxR-like ATPase
MSEKEKAKGNNKRSEERSARVDWPLVERALQTEQLGRIYLFGPSGIGKTFVAYQCGRTQRGLYSVTLTQETPAAELRGTYLPKGDELVWHDGPNR